MSISSELLKKATQEGSIPPPYLQPAVQVKDEQGNKKGVKSTGPHIVKFISDKEVKGTDYNTKQEREEIEYLFEEEGQKKRYSVPVKNENDELHYFVQRMAEIKEGETITLEYRKIAGSYKGYINIDRADEQEAQQEDDGIPTIDTDEPTEPRKVIPTAERGDVPIEEINTDL